MLTVVGSENCCHICNEVVEDVYCPRCSKGFVEEIEGARTEEAQSQSGGSVSTPLERISGEYSGEAAREPQGWTGLGTRLPICPRKAAREPQGRAGPLGLGTQLPICPRKAAREPQGRTDPLGLGTQLPICPPFWLMNLWIEEKVNRGIPQFIIAQYEALNGVKIEWLQCAICFEMFGGVREPCETPCKHVFHGLCIRRWLKTDKSCPVCRHDIDEGDFNGMARAILMADEGEFDEPAHEILIDDEGDFDEAAHEIMIDDEGDAEDDFEDEDEDHDDSLALVRIIMTMMTIDRYLSE